MMEYQALAETIWNPLKNTPQQISLQAIEPTVDDQLNVETSIKRETLSEYISASSSPLVSLAKG